MNIHAVEAAQENIEKYFTIKKLIVAAMHTPEFSSFVAENFYNNLVAIATASESQITAYQYDGIQYDIKISGPANLIGIVQIALKQTIINALNDSHCRENLYYINRDWYEVLQQILTTNGKNIVAIDQITTLFPVLCFGINSNYSSFRVVFE